MYFYLPRTLRKDFLILRRVDCGAGEAIDEQESTTDGHGLGLGNNGGLMEFRINFLRVVNRICILSDLANDITNGLPCSGSCATLSSGVGAADGLA